MQNLGWTAVIIFVIYTITMDIQERRKIVQIYNQTTIQQPEKPKNVTIEMKK